MSCRNRRTAVVTGAGRGIGAAIAEELAAAGTRVAVNYVSREADAIATVNTILDAGGTAAAFRADVQHPGDLDALFEFAREKFGELDILVNNAGVPGTGNLDSLRPEMIDATLAVNVKGMLLASQRAIQAFGGQGGSIVNVSSVLSREPLPAQGLYAASKSAIEAVTRVLSQELGPRGVRVNAVAPGPIETDLLRESGLDEEAKAFLVSRTALGRLGRTDDIAKVVAFLTSDAARWVTGQVIDIDGGLQL